MNHKKILVFLCTIFLLDCIVPISAMRPSKKQWVKVEDKNLSDKENVQPTKILDVQSKQKIVTPKTVPQKGVATARALQPLQSVNRVQNQNVQNLKKNIVAPQKNLVVTAPLQQQPVNQIQDENVTAQQDKAIITRTDNVISIHEPSETPGHYREIILFKNCRNCPLPGVYYKTAKGLVRAEETLLSKNGVAMYNPLLNLTYTEHVWTKNDLVHNFTEEVDKEAGPWARTVIKNDIENPNSIYEVKKQELFITIPGQIIEVDNSTGQRIIKTKLSGVFEFVVIKNLYTSKGLCVHRFFSPRGVVGVEEFGARAKKIMNQ